MWIHENKRVFGDRLIEDWDRNWLNQTLETQCQNVLTLKTEEIYNSDRIIFGDFMAGLEVEPRIYCQIINLKTFLQKIIEYLEEYNQGTKNKMKLVMFLDACDHVARIARCI